MNKIIIVQRKGEAVDIVAMRAFAAAIPFMHRHVARAAARWMLAKTDDSKTRFKKPVAWLCEIANDGGTVSTRIVTENPEGLRFNDSGEPSPFRVTPLYTLSKP